MPSNPITKPNEDASNTIPQSPSGLPDSTTQDVTEEEITQTNTVHLNIHHIITA